MGLDGGCGISGERGGHKGTAGGWLMGSISSISIPDTRVVIAYVDKIYESFMEMSVRYVRCTGHNKPHINGRKERRRGAVMFAVSGGWSVMLRGCSKLQLCSALGLCKAVHC